MISTEFSYENCPAHSRVLLAQKPDEDCDVEGAPYEFWIIEWSPSKKFVKTLSSEGRTGWMDEGERSQYKLLERL